jgi:hypothetical protein
LRLIFDEVPMPWDWPVVVNYHEAAAFAKWRELKTGRPTHVLTELEHKALRGGEGVREDGKRFPVRDHAVEVPGHEMMQKVHWVPS